MKRMLATLRRLSLLAMWLVSVSGCAPTYPSAIITQSDGSTLCTTDEQCIPPQVCDLGGTMMCVQCTMNKHDACTGTTPICGGHICQKCTEHVQCTMSNVCLPDGSCADEAQVAYVQPGGSGSVCTKTAPCGTLNTGVQANKPIVKIAAGTIADNKTTLIDGKVVMILAEQGAKLSRMNDGVILEIQNAGTDVQIFDLEITGGGGITNPVVYIVPNGGTPRLTLTRVTIDLNQGLGILADAGLLTISRSIIRGNTGGGISIRGAQFDITNSYIVQNGSDLSLLGGLYIYQVLPTGTHRLNFNTIAANTSTIAQLSNGVSCASIGMLLSFDSNIIFDNDTSGGGKQIGDSPMCTAIYSDVGPSTFSGIGNINANPMFANPAQGDFHLMGTSPARDAANPAATLGDDFDGDARPLGQRRDMGADEIKP